MGKVLQLPQTTRRTQRKNPLRSSQRKVIVPNGHVPTVTAPYTPCARPMTARGTRQRGVLRDHYDRPRLATVVSCERSYRLAPMPLRGCHSPWSDICFQSRMANLHSYRLNHPDDQPLCVDPSCAQTSGQSAPLTAYRFCVHGIRLYADCCGLSAMHYPRADIASCSNASISCRLQRDQRGDSFTGCGNFGLVRACDQTHWRVEPNRVPTSMSVSHTFCVISFPIFTKTDTKHLDCLKGWQWLT